MYAETPPRQALTTLCKPVSDRQVHSNARFARQAPCWYVAAGDQQGVTPRSLRCLPFFYLLGPFHSGGSDLYSRLAAHPDVVVNPAPHLHFWAESRPPTQMWKSYSEPSADVMAAPSTAVFGDASPSAFTFYRAHGVRFHEDYMTNLQPCYADCNALQGDKDACKSECFAPAMAAQRAADKARGAELNIPTLLRAVYAAAGGGAERLRLVATLREPTARLHHAFWTYEHYRKRYGETPEGFLEFVREQIGAMERCFEEFTERECAVNFEGLSLENERVFFHADQVLRGLYVVFAEEWLDAFPEGQLLFVRSEDLFDDDLREGVMREVWHHLGLRVPDGDAFAKATAQHVSKDGALSPAGRELPPMLPEAKALVDAFYEPFNARLSALLGDERFRWA